MIITQKDLLLEIGIKGPVENLTKLDWKEISYKYELTEEFIREFQDKVHWLYASYFQTLSEDFIREFKEKVDWGCISAKQNLSNDFLLEFGSKIKWNTYFSHQEADFSIVEEFISQTDYEDMKDFKISHLNKIQIGEIQKRLNSK